MSDGSPLISLGDLTKPATVLIEKISDAIGGIAAPYQMVRMAKAEATAERIRADARADLETRALERLAKEEARKQENIEQITRLALPHVDGSARPDAMDDDWIVNFFDKCRLTGDKDMQLLWSRILSGEANAPGCFGKRTVNLVATLTRIEAEQFTLLCSTCWKMGDDADDIVPIVINEDDVFYRSYGVTFDLITHLSSIGLIRYQSDGFSQVEHVRTPTFSYFERRVRLTLPFPHPQKSDFYLPTGRVLLTRVGLELARIAGAEPSDAFFEHVLSAWRAQRFHPMVVPTTASAG